MDLEIREIRERFPNDWWERAWTIFSFKMQLARKAHMAWWGKMGLNLLTQQSLVLKPETRAKQQPGCVGITLCRGMCQILIVSLIWRFGLAHEKEAFLSASQGGWRGYGGLRSSKTNNWPCLQGFCIVFTGRWLCFNVGRFKICRAFLGDKILFIYY